MGVLVFMLALLPKMTGRTSHLMRAESPGPSLSKIVPKLGDTAKILYALYLLLSLVLFILLILLFPTFANINDLNIALMLQENFPMVAAGTILLVPVAEETLFRGLIFRGLYDRSPVLAYLVSMFSFAAVHVLGYIGHTDPVLILLSFLQYLPAGYCLCFAYRRGGSIISPILMHMAVNAVAVYSMR